MRLPFLTALLIACSLPLQAADWRSARPTADNFADARDAVVTAIENRGLVINYTGRIGEMLERTAGDLGATRRVYRHAEVVEFCSASLSRQMVEADPQDIVNCPFTIAVYTLAEAPGGTWIAYRKPGGKSADALEKLLRDIVDEAAR
ncbi:uncharacterized protein DUF302 [Azonexus fungiphilus]|uniref:Uncharacterized protein DUF302 n=1 Tax=Azonexus fungiphilus TaxID=146940 RepID=A0A495WMJ2_9RHOO|nr:DUF302 domain-containing protein [Azonexus fungiphilus]RKT63041.1 uncharacterized protein DUF302 [Azonexus fungiphilus]